MTSDVKKFTYPSPVDKLLTLGDARESTKNWPNYQDIGLTETDTDNIIRMALDVNFYLADPDTPQAWAKMHAWRALGQLRAEAAIEDLLNLFWHVDEVDDVWVGEELPLVYGLIGPRAIPALTAYLIDPRHGVFARIAAARSLEEIGKGYAEARTQCIDSLCQALKDFAGNDLTLNAFLVSPLVNWQAQEALPLIEKAFAAGCVDEWVRGDWEDVQIDLGLKDERTHQRKLHPLYQELLESNLIS